MSLEAMVFTLSQVSISQERLQNTSGKNKPRAEQPGMWIVRVPHSVPEYTEDYAAMWPSQCRCSRSMLVRSHARGGPLMMHMPSTILEAGRES